MSYFLGIDTKEAANIAAIDDDGNEISYGDLVLYCNGLQRTISSRSLVFHFSENSVDSLCLYMACMHAKAVPLLLSPQTERDLISSLIKKYQPNYIVAPERICHYFDGEVVEVRGNYKLLKLNSPAHRLFDQLSLLLPTSGSTGSPKLVRHSYHNLEMSAKNVSQFFGLVATDKAFLFLPMYYTMGLSVIHSHLKVGAAIVFTKSAMTDAKFWSLLKESSPTVLTGVPYSFEILKKLRFFRMKMPSLRILTQGGGKLSKELYDDCLQYAENNNVEFIPTYGQTEGSARMTFVEPFMSTSKKGSIGKAIPGGMLSIIDDQGYESFEGEAAGELVYRGPNVTLGYANSLEDLNLDDDRHGILHTGDLVERDADGYYFIVGRKSRFLKLFGIRVALDEIEKLINDSFELDCACGGNDQKMIVLITRADMTQKVSDFIVAKTGLFHQSFEVVYVEDIPRNETGKVIFNDHI
ncbi:AMP-binding protein [Gelidibacter mesophilus]|uniref:AMP-binding protein n=1 Tax=Gelidibacter mesophilus TaxID=169050 RepID=UPI00042653E8|nr:AMP-binding protein [Gelidibacter mesophilus]